MTNWEENPFVNYDIKEVQNYFKLERKAYCVMCPTYKAKRINTKCR